MSLEQLHNGLKPYSADIDSGKMSIDAALDNIWNICFAKPKVSESEFLAVCRKYDPNFAPISSGAERRARTELTEQVRQAFRQQLKRQYYAIDPEINRMYGNHIGGKNPVIQRWHRPLFRGLTPEAQQDLVKLIASDDKKAMGEYYLQRVNSKKEQLLAMLDMDDAALAKNFFQYKDELDLIKELEKFKDCILTEEHQKIYNELHDWQSPLENLARRVDMIANPYYAKFPCERLEMRDDEAMAFYYDMTGLAKLRGESIGTADANNSQNIAETENSMIAGPSHDLASAYSTLRGFAVTVLDQKMTDFVRTYEVEKPRSCVWAGENGKVGLYETVIDSLNKHKLIFVDIPGAGTKALRNIGNGFANCTPVEATGDDVRAYMLSTVEKGLNRVDAANPFLLSVFTGSGQYNQMAAQHKAVKEMMQTLKFPLSDEAYLEATQAIINLQQSTNAYLDYKRNQGLEQEGGMPVGRSANERSRIAAARENLELADTLNFLIQYQQDEKEVSRQMQSQQKQREAKYTTKFQPKPSAEIKKPNAYAEEDLCKTTPEDLQSKVQLYEKMPACQPSTAGNAMNKLQKEVPAAFDLLIKFTKQTNKVGDSTIKNFKQNLAKIVLFDYILRERMARNGEEFVGTVVAGPVEQALNNHAINHSNLAASPEFNSLLGRFTPARIEAFLNNEESRKTVFDDAVRSVLSPVKDNRGMANQPIPQPQNNPVRLDQGAAQQQIQQPDPKPAQQVMGGPNV